MILDCTEVDAIWKSAIGIVEQRSFAPAGLGDHAIQTSRDDLDYFCRVHLFLAQRLSAGSLLLNVCRIIDSIKVHNRAPLGLQLPPHSMSSQDLLQVPRGTLGGEAAQHTGKTNGSSFRKPTRKQFF